MERSSEWFSRLTVFGLFARINQTAYRMTESTKISIPSRGFYGTMVVGLEETHRTLQGSLLEAQARQMKYTDSKEMFKAGDMDY